MSEPGLTLLQREMPDGQTRWFTYRNPLRTLEAWTPSDMPALFREAEAARDEGLHAVGWVAYEAAPAFDPHLTTHPPMPGLPLARFRIYPHATPGLPPATAPLAPCTDWSAAFSPEAFAAHVRTIRTAIARGETYQVNFTAPNTARFQGDPLTLFHTLRLAQSARHQAYLDEGDQVILCVSPERFFHLAGEHIRCRPMKGTAPPHAREQLATSTKDLAENVMIVDMIRNDLGKIARPGSVQVPRLFEIETYPSLHQLTSTIEARGHASVFDWFQALFPCASITGAPKRKTMEWIRQLETGPRGIYTGAIGGLFPDGHTEFNVAIRTAILSRSTQTLRFDTGCGIVWDSDPDAEYRESQLKTHVIRQPPPPFQLIETLQHDPASPPRWPRHRDRLLRAAAEFGFPLTPQTLDADFAAHTASLTSPAKVRLLVDPDGTCHWTLSPPPPPVTAWSFAVDTVPTPSDHPALRHKTTRRQIYDEAAARFPRHDEVLLVNERGELMEFRFGNLLVNLDGNWFTPPQHSGLLPGTTRAQLLQSGDIRERILRPADLAHADAIQLINAVRGRLPMIYK